MAIISGYPARGQILCMLYHAALLGGYIYGIQPCQQRMRTGIHLTPFSLRRSSRVTLEGSGLSCLGRKVSPYYSPFASV